MHTPIQDEHKFGQLMPCAADIFEYAKEHPEVRQGSWGFDSGNYSDELDKVWASFSSVAYQDGVRTGCTSQQSSNRTARGGFPTSWRVPPNNSSKPESLRGSV